MSLELEALAAAVAAHERVARVVVARDEGSAPRETGAAMLVWAEGQTGTIGGGRLEYEATRRARAALAEGREWIERVALGTAVGQCCGGRVTLLCEIFDAARIEAIGREAGAGGIWARPVPGAADARDALPAAVRKILEQAGAEGAVLPVLAGEWMLEPMGHAARALWVFGAGHVGRAIVGTLAPLPDFAITWLDTAPERFPSGIPANVRALPAPDPAASVALAPGDALHLVLTSSHALDFEICHRLLGHGFGWAGLIGSPTKWARFRKRLAALGHAPEEVARIVCPIGRREFGKHPQAIAVGVAAGLLEEFGAGAGHAPGRGARGPRRAGKGNNSPARGQPASEKA